VFVYFTHGRERGVSSAELEELAQDSGRAGGASGETIVARLDAATRISEGQDAELWVDARAAHIFDPATGRNLSLAGDGDGDGGAATVQTASGAEAGQPETVQAETVQPETVDPNATATEIRAVPGQAGQAGQGGEAT